jgi:hypothetical protein
VRPPAPEVYARSLAMLDLERAEATLRDEAAERLRVTACRCDRPLPEHGRCVKCGGPLPKPVGGGVVRRAAPLPPSPAHTPTPEKTPARAHAWVWTNTTKGDSHG